MAREEPWSRFHRRRNREMQRQRGAEPEEKDDEASKSGGRWATYVFNIMPRSQYPAQDMGAKTDEMLART